MISRGKGGRSRSVERAKSGGQNSKEVITAEGKEAEGRGSRRKC